MRNEDYGAALAGTNHKKVAKNAMIRIIKRILGASTVKLGSKMGMSAYAMRHAKQEQNVYRVTAIYDKDTGRWTALSDDIPGLVCEAANFEELTQVVQELAPELLELNKGLHLEHVPFQILADFTENHSRA